MFHLIVVGAGAAGLTAAGQAVRLGCRVTLLEHSGMPGKKILVTGKGRCNVTNDCDEQEFLQHVRTNPRFLYSAIAAFPPRSTMEWMESLGVPLKTERGRRVFPVSDKAEDIRAALCRWAEGAKLVQADADSLVLENGRAVGVQARDGRRFVGDGVLVATGGLSYPATGSTGDGYRLAQQAGHGLVQPVPSLVSLVTAGGDCRRMMGLALKNVALTLEENGKPVFCEQGEMLFTHFGISGPLVLSASAWVRDLKKYRYQAVIDLKPALTPEQLYARIGRDFDLLAGKNAANCLQKLVPATMQPVLLERWGVDPALRVNQIDRGARLRLVALLKGFAIPIRDRGDLQHAVITAGGVPVKEVNPRTMESKKTPGLYFAGEVLDLDAYTGGYNLQIAFATAMAAAKGFAAQA